MVVPASSPSRASPPRPRSRLIGRESERVAARTLLLDEDVPLITLTGPGGVGKTRLALAIAGDVAESFTSGVLWVDLAPLADPALVPAAVASAVGISFMPGSPVEDDLIRHLRPCQILLLLDNCECVLASTADLIAVLLDHCPALQVLVTSRAPLHVRGEHILPVEPLPLPAPGSPSLETLARNEAVRLFVDRAHAVRPVFALTTSNAPTVAAVCRKLDGLPLAIELAAARITILSPEALLAQMSDRLRLLRGGARDTPARQQTIRNTIAWSYDLLDPEQQALFRRLAVFVGGFTLEAAEYVGGWRGEEGGASLLASLVEQSLLRRLEDGDGEPRFTMLETIREFASESLEHSDEGETVRAAHAHYFARLASDIDAARSGLADPRIADQIATEGGNLRAALAWLRSGNDSGATLRMASSLWPLWLEHGAVTEGRVLLEECLARPDARDDLFAWARAAATLALLAQVHGAHALVAEWSTAALEICQADDSRGAGMALTARGLDAMVRGDYRQARDDLSEAFQKFHLAGDPRSGSWALRHLASIAFRTGEGDALELARKGLVVAEKHGNALDVAKLLHTLGTAQAARGDLAGASRSWRESLRRFRENDDAWGAADALSSLGAAAFESGNATRALRLLTKALEGFSRVGDPEGTALTLGRVGWVKRALGDLDAAERQFDAGLRLARSSTATLVEISCLHGLAATALTRRDTNAAAAALRDALGVPGVSETRPLLADGIEWGAHVMAAVGQPTSSAHIVGAVSCYRERLNVSAPRSLLREREGLIASLRSALGDATFAMLHADGQTMPVATAMRAILDECAAIGQDPIVRQSDPLDALTRRERDVLALLREHYTDREIADFLFLSRRTVSSHVASILHKLGVANRKGAAAIAARQGLASPRTLTLTDPNPA